MLKYVASVDNVIKAIEKMSRDPVNRYLDPNKHEEIYINRLLRKINNARSQIQIIGPEIYFEGLSEEYTLDEICDISKRFLKEEISEKAVDALLGDVYDELKRVIMNEMDYKKDKDIDRYVKGKKKKRKRFTRILRR